MNSDAKKKASTVSAPASGKAREKKPGRSAARPSKEDRETRLLAALVLEVLAGLKTPTEAASVLEVSVARYYALEFRALEGLLSACRRRPRGPQPNPERELAKLKREIERLERECTRTTALLRSAERALGLPRALPPKPEKAKGKKRRKRRPTVRALRAAKILRSEQVSVSIPEGALPQGGEEAETPAAS
jgi:hypothetical protein